MEEMTARQRILNSIQGKEIDRFAFCPFLAYYWEYLPKDVQACGQVHYLNDIGADPLLRGFHRLAQPVFEQCNITERIAGNLRQLKYQTAVGALTLEYTYSQDGNTWFLTGHPVKNAEDFKVLTYLYENISFRETIQAFELERKALGEGGVALPTLGTMEKTAFQSLVEHWCGTENLIYALYDFPEAVEECLAIMQQKDMETVEISLKSSADGFIFGEDSSTTNINPEMFQLYTLPEINCWGKAIHQSGKLLIHHACGHLRSLLPLISSSEIDALESVTPPPTGNISLQEARTQLSSHIAIIGGVEPTLLLNSTLEELGEHTKQILCSMRGQRYILANSDSCPPGVAEEKLRLLAGIIRDSHKNRVIL